ncbi:MAG: hypothetical protein AAF492_28270, partial [Verrucomicrobiota bacterium]
MGKTTVYTYDDANNLLTITDGKGQTYLQNTYSPATDPNDPNFDRIISQIWGNPGDRFDLVYIPQTPAAETNGAIVMRTIINDRMGNVLEYFFDKRNRVARKRIYTGRADPDQPTTATLNRPTGKLRPEDPDFFETRYEWNEQSLKTREIHPNGNITEYVYESDLNPNATARDRANLRQIRHLPGSHAPAGDQAVIEEFYEYDADFSCGSCGFNFVTRHVDARGNETLKSYDAVGNLTNIIHRIPSIREDFEYNEFGQLTKLVHPDNGSGHRRVDRFVYYTHDEDDDQEGYLKDMIVDADNLALTTSYEYDLVGNSVRVTDPRGHDTQYVYNELNQIVREVSREVTDGSGIRYETDFYFDANNNLIRRDVQNIDDMGLLQS